MTRTPTSTYRLQITEDFDLVAAARTVAYLHELGVDWVYLSPLLAVGDRQRPRLRRVRPPGHRPVARAARPAWPRWPPRRSGSAWGCWSTSSRTTSGWRGRRRTSGGGTCSPTARSRRTPSAFDIDWAAGGGRLRIPVVGDDDLLPDGRIDNLSVARRRAALPRPALPAGAGQRARIRRGPQRRARPAALRADQLARGGQQT